MHNNLDYIDLESWGNISIHIGSHLLPHLIYFSWWYIMIDLLVNQSTGKTLTSATVDILYITTVAIHQEYMIIIISS